jgi:hypothetical protein
MRYNGFNETWPYSKILEFSVAFLIHSLAHTDLDERFSSILEGDDASETLTFTLTISLTPHPSPSRIDQEF